MKRFPLFVIFFFAAVMNLVAQVELGPTDERFEILRNYEISTGKNLDTKSLFKLTRNGEISNNIELSYERKISSNFSILGSIRGERYYNFISTSSIPSVLDTLIVVTSFEGEVEVKYRMELSVEGRYYVHQGEMVKQGYGDNVNGFYVSAGLGAILFDASLDSELPIFNYLGIGVQSRILKHGILDFSLLTTYKRERFSVGPNVRAGFAISKDYKTLEFSNARCNILKCFEERNYQFKIPLTNSFYMSYKPSWNHAFVGLTPVIKFEHRILKGLSFNHAIRYSNLWNINSNTETNIRQSGSRFGYANSLRWYLLKSKNIAAGKSADNLSGFYAESFLAINFGKILSFGSSSNRINIGKTRSKSYGANIGYQTRLFKRLYVDVQGYLRRIERADDYIDPELDLRFANNNQGWTRYGVSLEFGFLF